VYGTLFTSLVYGTKPLSIMHSTGPQELSSICLACRTAWYTYVCAKMSYLDQEPRIPLEIYIRRKVPNPIRQSV